MPSSCSLRGLARLAEVGCGHSMASRMASSGALVVDKIDKRGAISSSRTTGAAGKPGVFAAVTRRDQSLVLAIVKGRCWGRSRLRESNPHRQLGKRTGTWHVTSADLRVRLSVSHRD